MQIQKTTYFKNSVACIIRHTVYCISSVRRTVYVVHCTSYTARPTLYGIQCLRRTLYDIQCTYIILHTVSTTYNVRRTWLSYTIKTVSMYYIYIKVQYTVNYISYSDIQWHCTTYAGRRTVNSVCVVYILNVRYTLYTVQCTLYTVQRTLYNIQCTMCNVQCTVYALHTTV